jgi:hypothetical protein
MLAQLMYLYWITVSVIFKLFYLEDSSIAFVIDPVLLQGETGVPGEDLWCLVEAKQMKSLQNHPQRS